MQISWNFWPLSLLPKRDLIKYVSQMVILAPYSSFSVSISYVWGKSHFAIDRQEEKLTLFTRTFETYGTEAINVIICVLYTRLDLHNGLWIQSGWHKHSYSISFSNIFACQFPFPLTVRPITIEIQSHCFPILLFRTDFHGALDF